MSEHESQFEEEQLNPVAALTVEQFKEAVREIDPKLAPTSSIFKAMVVLLSIGRTGFDLDAICEFTGYSKKRGIIQKFMTNIEKSGIYKDGVLHCNWDDEDHGWLALMMDAFVADGKLTRAAALAKVDAQIEKMRSGATIQ